MTKKMRRKGQSALEATFVVLFIALVIIVIFEKTLATGTAMGDMGEARAVAQSVALELSMKGTLTHLIRVDPGEEGGVDVYAMSKDCGDAEDAFDGKLQVDLFRCSEQLYQGGIIEEWI